MSGELNFIASIGTAQLKRDSQRVQNQFTQIGNKAEAEGVRVDQTFRRIGAGIAGYFGTQQLFSFAKAVAMTRGEFQQLEVAFTTMLKSKAKADALMVDIVDFAATTPYELKDVGKGAKQLLAFQVPAKEITSTLRQIGDLAAGVGAPLNDLVSIYGKVKAKGKLQAEEMNLFLERGIPLVSELATKYKTSESAIYDMASKGKIGFEDLKGVMSKLTDEGGMFFNLMDEQSKTITGQISNLSDAWDSMLNEIGQSSEGAISGAIDGAKFLVENYNEVAKILGTLIASYGVYKASVIAVASIQKTKGNLHIIEESKQLENLISVEAKEKLSKEGLVVGTKEYANAIKVEVAANIEALRVTSAKAQADALAAKSEHKAALQRAISAKALVGQRKVELSLAQLNGNAKQVEASKLAILKAEEERHLAVKLRKNTAYKLSIANTNKESAAKALNAVQTKLNSATDIAATRSKNLLRVATNGLSKSFKSLRLAFASNPFGLILTALTIIVPLISQFTGETEKAIESTEDLKSASEKLTDSIASETAEMNSLFDKLKNTNEGTDTRKVLINELNEKYGQYLPNLLTEKSTLIDIKKAQEEANKALINNIAIKAQKSDRTKVLEAQIKREQEAFKELAEKNKVSVGEITAAYNDYLNSSIDGFGQAGDFSSFFALGDEFKRASSDAVRTISDLSSARRKDARELEAVADLYSGYITELEKTPTGDDLNTNKGTKGKDDLKLLRNLLSAQRSEYEKYNSDIKGLTGERKEAVRGEYQYLINQGERYLDFLNNLLSREKNAKKQGVIKHEISIVTKENKINEQRSKQEKLDEQKAELKELQKQYATYLDKRNALQDKYDNAILILTRENNRKQAIEAHIAREQELKELDSNFARNNDRFKNWLENELPNIAKQGIGELQQELNNLEASVVLVDDENTEKSLKQLAIYGEKIKELKAKIQSSGETSTDTWEDTLKLMGQIRESVSDIISNFDGLDDTTKDSLNAILGLSDGVFAVADGIKNLSAGLKGLEKASVILAIASAAISIISKISGFFKKNKEAEEAHQRALEEITKSKIAQQQEYNKLLREQAMLMEEAVSVFGEKQIARAANFIGVYKDAIEEYYEVLKGDAPTQKQGMWAKFFEDEYKKQKAAYDQGVGALANTKVVTGSKTVSSGFLGLGKKQKDVYSGILDVYPDLITAENRLNIERAQAILNSQRMSESDKELLQTLIGLEEEAKKAEEALESYLSETYGSLGSEIMNSLEEALRSGTDAWEDFGDAGTKVLEDLGKQITYSLFFAEMFKDLEKQLKNIYSSGGSEEDIANNAAALIENFYSGIGSQMDSAQDFMANWDEQLAGFDLWSGGSREASQKGFASMSQDSADELNGRFTAIQGHTYEINTGVKILSQNSAKILDLLGGIEVNTRHLEVMKQDMHSLKVGMDNINTKGITIKS